MREILFRGKTRHGKWVYGWFCGKTLNIDMTGTEDCSHIIDFNTLYWHEVIPEIVGQYTGLTDKNGKKIFEGDVFKFPDEIFESYYTSCGTEYNSWETENYGVIGFDEDSGRYDFVQYRFENNVVEADLHENKAIDFADFVKELEVIGNIHDNPELLEVDK